MSFVMSLDTDTFFDLIGTAIEKDFDDRVWEKWLVELPTMQQKGNEFIPFEEYLKRHKEPKHINIKSDEEVLNDAANILKSIGKQ